jgi:hypothetical protein
MGQVLEAVRIVKKELRVGCIRAAGRSRGWLDGEGVESACHVDVDNCRKYPCRKSCL